MEPKIQQNNSIRPDILVRKRKWKRLFRLGARSHPPQSRPYNKIVFTKKQFSSHVPPKIYLCWIKNSQFHNPSSYKVEKQLTVMNTCVHYSDSRLHNRFFSMIGQTLHSNLKLCRAQSDRMVDHNTLAAERTRSLPKADRYLKSRIRVLQTHTVHCRIMQPLNTLRRRTPYFNTLSN